jgi:RND family efflux transporter MFP subunit
MVKVTERDVLNVRKGQTVSVTADVYPSRPISGKVTNIGLRADNAFNYDVEIEVPNPKNAPMRAGMHAKAIFTFDAQRQGLVLPRKAIAGSLQDARVYIVEDSVALLRTVTLGGAYGDKVEVMSGLKEGERVVVAGQMNLADGTKVEVVH